MKVETDRVLAQARTAAHPGWAATLAVAAGCIVLILALYWQTALSIGRIWWRSETFTHGFLIVPIALWLIWGRRRELAPLAPVREPLGLLVLAAAAGAWLVAAAGQVQVVQQYALTLMIPAAVLALTGRAVTRALAFPLAFLFLGVPVGEALIPPLMEWTADFTVAALQLTGIPVFREGLYFTIPSGNWSVVEGCSGLRYLIASVTVGLLYAYLNYQRLWKRLLFVASALAVPIVANGARAYMIVMIAHLSDMKLAMGVDHFIYGWVFFGLVMLLLFWLGSFWRDGEPARRRRASSPGVSRRASLAGCALAIVALAASAPLYAAFLESPKSVPSLAAPAGAAGWTRTPAPLTDWRPRYDPAPAAVFETYRKGSRTVGVFLAYYRDQRPGAQLVTSTNVMVVQKHPVWSNVGEKGRAEAAGRGVTLRETRLRSPSQRLLVWDWFWISGEHLANPYLAKLYIARDRLIGRGDEAAAIVLAAPYEERPEMAEAALREFAAEMLTSIEAALAAARQTR